MRGRLGLRVTVSVVPFALAACGGETSATLRDDASAPSRADASDVADAHAPDVVPDAAVGPETGVVAIEAGVADAGGPTRGCGDVPNVPACDPGAVACGGIQCDVPANACCEADGGAQCNGSCAAGPSPVLVMKCDEAADCPGTQPVCCLFSIYAASYATVTCQSWQCQGHMSNPQVCKTDAECFGGLPCIPNKCTLVGTTLTLGICGSHSPYYCTPL